MSHKISDKPKVPNKRMAILLALLMASSFLTNLIIFPSQTVSAQSLAAANAAKPDWNIKSYLYYKAITNCLENAGLSGGSVYKHYIKEENAKSGKWFGAVGIYGIRGYFIKDYATGHNVLPGATCSEPKLITDAMAFWKINIIDALCWSNFERANPTESEGVRRACYDDQGSDLVQKGGGKIRTRNIMEASAQQFSYYINWKVYGGERPDKADGSGKVNPPVGSLLDDKERSYVYFRNSLENSGLIPGIKGSAPTILETDQHNGLTKITWVDFLNLNKKTVGYYDSQASNADLSLARTIFNFDEANTEFTGYQMIEAMNKAANNIAELPPGEKPTVDDTHEEDVDTEATAQSCNDHIKGIGWIICAAMRGLGTLNDGMWKVASGLLKVNPLKQGDSTYKAWGIIRNIANVAFVIVFLIMVFSQISSFGISNYGIKKLLPRLIVCAILVNSSFIIMQLVIDLANIIGSSLYDVLISVSPASTPKWTDLIAVLEGAKIAGIAATGGILLAGGPAAAFWLILPMVAMGALSLILAVLTLIFRQAILPILAILAPLAFVAYLLPNTEKLFKKWTGLLIPMLTLYPLAAIIFGGARFAAGAMVGEDHNTWDYLIGLVMLSLPLFSLPIIAKKSGALVGAVGGFLAGMAMKAKAPVGNFSKERQALRASNFAANKTGIMADGYRKYQYGKFNRKKQTEINNKKLDSSWKGTADGRQLAMEGKDVDSAGNVIDKRLDTDWQRSSAGIGAYASEKSAGADNDEAKKAADTAWLRSNAASQAKQDEIVAQAENDLAAADLEANVPISLNIEAEIAKKGLENAKNNTARLLKEAATEGGNNSQIPHDTDATRMQLIEAQRQANVIASKITSAERVLKDDYQTELAHGGLVAQMAGGVDPNGKSRAQAGALSAMSKTFSEDVAAEKILQADQNYTKEELVNIVSSGKLRNNAPANEEQIHAAVQSVMEKGDVNTMNGILDFAASHPADAPGLSPEESKKRLNFQQTVSEAYLKSPGKEKGIGGKVIDMLSNGKYGSPVSPSISLSYQGQPLPATVENMEIETSILKGFSVQQIASMDPDETRVLINGAKTNAGKALLGANSNARDALIKNIKDTMRSKEFQTMNKKQADYITEWRRELENIARTSPPAGTAQPTSAYSTGPTLTPFNP